MEELKKDELLEQARELEVPVASSATKAEIIEALERAPSDGVYTIEGSLSDAGFMESPDGHKVKEDNYGE